MAEEVIRNEPVAYGVVPELRDVIRRISWGAVWAGLMVALGMEVLFTLFGCFIGFGMYHWQAADPWSGISAWSAIWYLVTVGWSMFFGAWCAAHLSGNPIVSDRILHGITTWDMATAVTIAIVAVASFAVLREGINVLSTAAIAAGQVAPAVSPGAIPPDQLSQAAQQAIGQVQANAGPTGQATAHIISRLSLLIWGGVLLGFIAAIIGGWVGSSRTVAVAPQDIVQDVVPVPTRRAA